MRYVLLISMILFSLTGCEEKEKNDAKAQAEHDAKIAKMVRAQVLAEFEAQKEAAKKQHATQRIQVVPEETPHTTTQPPHSASSVTSLSSNDRQVDIKPQLDPMGIHIKKESITIDTNQTKRFFHAIGNALDSQIKRISNDLKKGLIQSDEAGIHIDNGHINVDLNKTHSLLNKWGAQIDAFVAGIDALTNPQETNTTPKGE